MQSAGCVCVVSAVNDGNCSLRCSATVSVVQESMWWKGNQIRDSSILNLSQYLFFMDIKKDLIYLHINKS